MTVSLVQWRAVTGIFNFHSSVMSKSSMCNLTSNFISAFENLFLFYHYQESAYIFFITLLYQLVLLQYHGYTELKPGPKN